MNKKIFCLVLFISIFHIQSMHCSLLYQIVEPVDDDIEIETRYEKVKVICHNTEAVAKFLKEFRENCCDDFDTYDQLISLDSVTLFFHQPKTFEEIEDLFRYLENAVSQFTIGDEQVEVTVTFH